MKNNRHLFITVLAALAFLFGACNVSSSNSKREGTSFEESQISNTSPTSLTDLSSQNDKSTSNSSESRPVEPDSLKVATIDYYKFELNDGGASYSITGHIKDDTIQKLVIPSTYNNLPVTSISDGAFRECESIISLVIPDSITTIGVEEAAFSSCYSLAFVTIGKGVSSFAGAMPFYSCDSLTWIDVDSDNPYYSSIDGTLFNKDKTILICCPPTKKGAFVMPNTVVATYHGAFAHCNFISITLSTNLTTIGKFSFIYCTNLTSIVIPSSVVSIGEGAFEECYRLVEVINKSSLSITIGDYDNNGGVGYYAKRIITGESQTNVNIRNDGFITFSFDNEVYLINYIDNQSKITIPNEITTINDYCFYACSWLTEVIITECVSTIGKYCFTECPSLAKVTIKNGVTSIGGSAFTNCPSITSIIIPSSVEYIGRYAFNDCIVYCRVESKPAGWVENWNHNCQVYWGYTGE